MLVRRNEAAAPQGSRSLLEHPSFLRLWSVGGLSNVVLWLEILAASLFTMEATGSATAVALVSAARAIPLLVLGALAGVISDSWSRKHVVVAGLVVSAGAAGTVAILAATGAVRPWHIAVAALVSGCVYATEMPARRRMVAESGGQGRVDAAVALDGLTGYLARCVGPLCAGLIYQRFGLAGAYGGSAACSLVGLLIIRGLEYRQESRPFRIGGLGRDFGEAWRFAIRSPQVRMLFAVTLTMNFCVYSYTAITVPFSQIGYALDATMTGLVAAAEPFGAFLAGLLFTRYTPPGSRLVLLRAGVAILGCSLLAAGTGALLGFPIGPVLLCLVLGGIGSALYTNQQTGIVVAEVPAAMRSRVMGLVTVAIGVWPFGLVMAGVLARELTPATAFVVLAVSALLAITALSLIGASQRAAEAR